MGVPRLAGIWRCCLRRGVRQGPLGAPCAVGKRRRYHARMASGREPRGVQNSTPEQISAARQLRRFIKGDKLVAHTKRDARFIRRMLKRIGRDNAA